MKKTFSLTHAKLSQPRLVDSIKHEIRKYIKRERRRELPEDADFWDFACKFGAGAENATVLHVDEIGKAIDKAVSDGLPSFYLEVRARPATRLKKTRTRDVENA